MKKNKGFSLIELLIVVAIILIIAAIAIPNLIRSKMQANEASAVASLRTMNTAEVTYQNTYQIFGTQAQIGSNANPCVPAAADACLIDMLLTNATAAANAKSGYYFKISNVTNATYSTEAEPANQGTTGVRGFCSDQNLVLYWVNPGGAMGTCTTAGGTAL